MTNEYSFDPGTRELVRNGRKMRLAPQPARVLQILMHRAGELVTREEIAQQVWGPETYVDFEHGLNFAIRQIRECLGESAEQPRYIETVPKAGYRFIAPVPAVKTVSGSVLEGRKVPEAEVAAPERSRSKTSLCGQLSRNRAVIALTLAVLLILVFRGYRLRKADHTMLAATAIQPRRSVAILGFQNLSGRADPTWLSTAISEMLGTELVSGEQLRLVSSQEVALLRNNVAIPNTATLSKSTLAQIHQVIGADLVVLGSYSDLGYESGGKIRLDLRLQDTVAGETIVTISETGTEAGLFQLVSIAGADLRKRLGIRGLSEVDTATVPATLPANSNAERLYAEGLAKLHVFDAIAARDLLEQAVYADPKYAPAHSALSDAWSTLGYDRKATEEAKTAFELSQALGRRDRLIIEARYRVMNKEWDKALDLYHTLFNFFPDDVEYGLQLAETQIQANKGKVPSPGLRR